MAAEHRNATVVVVRMADQTADILRDLMAADPMDGRVAVDIRHDLMAADLTGGQAAVPGIEVAVLPIADPAAVAVVDIVAAVAVRAEAAVVRAEAAVVPVPQGRAVAAEGSTDKVATHTTGSARETIGITPTINYQPILRRLLKPGAEAREIQIKLAGAEELQQS